MKRRGFTAIELLIVLCIIAVLAAIIFPVFSQARAKARQTTCQSNLKQLFLAFRMYQQDYPRLDVILTSNFGLEKAIDCYLPKESLTTDYFNCAEDSRKCQDNDIIFHGYSVSYGWNRYTLGQATGREPQNGEYLPLVFDATATRVDRPCWPPGRNAKTLDPLALRHRNGMNVAFFDGHAKWVGLQEVVSGSWTDNFGNVSTVTWAGAYLEPKPKSVEAEPLFLPGFPEKVTGVEDGVYLFKVTGGKLEKVAGPLK